jgi:hypothetical protein
VLTFLMLLGDALAVLDLMVPLQVHGILSGDFCPMLSQDFTRQGQQNADLPIPPVSRSSRRFQRACFSAVTRFASTAFKAASFAT